MNAESIVVSLEWAKKLKEAGFHQDMCFQWFNYPNYEHPEKKEWTLEEGPCNGDTRGYAAPTAEEVLRKLPHFIQDSRLLQIIPDHKIRDHRRIDGWIAYYSDCSGKRSGQTPYGTEEIWQPSLANAVSAMYIYLSQNNLLPTP